MILAITLIIPVISNLWMKDAYTLIAKTDINRGEEITADYVLWEADEAYVQNGTVNVAQKFVVKR